jgi:cobyrinic acid a,c-diamide synthase
MDEPRGDGSLSPGRVGGKEPPCHPPAPPPLYRPMSSAAGAHPRLLLASHATGQGKTTVALALMAAYRARGLEVTPFKVGPDYIDPAHHRAAAGRASRNLDGWLLPHDRVRALFARAMERAPRPELAVIEGAMGLFDGASPHGDEGSSAEIAKLLRVPVVAVLDVWTMARSAAAVAEGLRGFDPELRLAGVILNRAAGEPHAELCRVALEERGIEVFGWLPRDPGLELPERHLGLVLPGESPPAVERLAALAERQLKLDRLLKLARAAPPLPAPAAGVLPERVEGVRAVIGVARDAAFDFYYEDNLDLLHDLGAEIRFFSPLRDAGPPEGAQALYLGGGYPELHAEELFVNVDCRMAVREFAASGRPVLAECGGLMYLSGELVDARGRRHRMAGVIPGSSRMRERLTIGYREVVALRDSPLATAGTVLRGHEFHLSHLDAVPEAPAYRRRDGEETEGVIAGPRGNVLASYIHVHFATDPALAERFVAGAAAARG